MALAKYSLTNLTNSFADRLSTEMLTAGYLLYWPSIDSLQTLDGVYPQYMANQASILTSNATVAARYTASKGVLTIRNDDFSFIQFPTRPTSDGAVVSPENVPIPSVVVHIQHDPNGGLLGLGSTARNRFASLDVYGLARNRGEQIYLSEVLRVAFDESQFLSIVDHDAGTRAPVGKVELQRTDVNQAIYPLGPDSMAFEFTLNARLRYEA